MESDSCDSGAGAGSGSDLPLSRVEGEVWEPVSGGSEDSMASSFESDFGGAFSPPASSKVKDSKEATSVPSSIITAIGLIEC